MYLSTTDADSRAKGVIYQQQERARAGSDQKVAEVMHTYTPVAEDIETAAEELDKTFSTDISEPALSAAQSTENAVQSGFFNPLPTIPENPDFAFWYSFFMEGVDSAPIPENFEIKPITLMPIENTPRADLEKLIQLSMEIDDEYAREVPKPPTSCNNEITKFYISLRSVPPEKYAPYLEKMLDLENRIQKRCRELGSWSIFTKDKALKALLTKSAKVNYQVKKNIRGANASGALYSA